MTARQLIHPETIIHATESHGITTLILTQGDSRIELAVRTDRVRQFHGDITDALTPMIHAATLAEVEAR